MRNWINLFESHQDEPSMMSTPRVLYRSVSIPELVSVAFRGEVTGGGNTFSGDNRRWVFFGDQLNSNLIHQGEDHSRYPSYAIRHHPIHNKFRANSQDVEEIALLAANTLRVLAKQKKWSAVTEELLDRLTWDESTARRMRSEYGRYAPDLKHILDDLIEAFEVRTGLRDQYQGLHKDSYETYKTARKDWGYTSAVIVTKPTDRGFHFRADKGESYHDGDEYGFYSGDITLDDIDHVMLYRNGEEVMRINQMDEILPILRKGGIDTQAYMQ